MGLYSKDLLTKMDLVAVDGANGGLKARTQYIKKKKIGRSFWSIALQSRQFRSPSFERPPLKVGLSPSKKNCVICVIERPLKMMKNAFYFILKALFVLKIFKFMSQHFGHVGKTA